MATIVIAGSGPEHSEGDQRTILIQVNITLHMMTNQRKSSCDLALYVGLIVFFFVCSILSARQIQTTPVSFQDLVTLTKELRKLEQPGFPNGVPDYTAATMRKIHQQLKSLQTRLASLNPSAWPIEERVDYELARAEMNALDFHIRVLRPWARDPAFYALIWPDQSDTPAHEGPTSHAAIDLWTHSHPLSSEDAKKLAAQLRTIPPLLEQARANLIGNARELWIAGIKNIRDQAKDLDDLAKKTVNAGRDFKDALTKAKAATVGFGEWLEQQAPSKTGPSGVGKESYTWHLRNVLLVPLSWEEEVSLLKRELDRAYMMLSLEKHRNRNLPLLKAISNPEEFARKSDVSIMKLMAFLRDKEILPVRDYMEPALREHIGRFRPDTMRNFFQKVSHLDPTVLFTHATHWFDLARMKREPHPSYIRRDALPFNIWMSRAEGLATGVEEMFMHAGLYDDNPRARELVWIMLAMRCARGLASLYAHANEISFRGSPQFSKRVDTATLDE